MAAGTAAVRRAAAGGVDVCARPPGTRRAGPAASDVAEALRRAGPTRTAAGRTRDCAAPAVCAAVRGAMQRTGVMRNRRYGPARRPAHDERVCGWRATAAAGLGRLFDLASVCFARRDVPLSRGDEWFAAR